MLSHKVPDMMHATLCGQHVHCRLVLQTFDYPSIGAISSFIADTKYPGGLPIASTAAVAAPAQGPAAPARALAPVAEAAGAVALTGMSTRFAAINSLAELYTHMRDGTELHTAAPFNR